MGGQGAPTPSQFGSTPVTGTTFHSMAEEKGNTHQRRTGEFVSFVTEEFQSRKHCNGLGWGWKMIERISSSSREDTWSHPDRLFAYIEVGHNCDAYYRNCQRQRQTVF